MDFIRTPVPPSRLLVGFGLALVGTLVAGVSVFTWQQREVSLADADRDASNLSLVLAEQTSTALQAVDELLFDAIDAVRISGMSGDAGNLSDQTIHEILKTSVSTVPQVLSLFVLDDAGGALHSSRSLPPPNFDASNRSYFIAHRNDPNVGLYISEPRRNRGDPDKWSFFLSRRIASASGDLEAVVVASVDLDYFETTYRTLRLPSGGSIALFHKNGVALAYHPHDDAIIGKVFTTPEQAADAMALGTRPGAGSDESKLMARLHDPQKQIVKSHGLSAYPLMISVALPRDATLATWRERTYQIGFATFGATLVIGVLVLLLVRQIARRERQDEALATSEARYARAVAGTNDGLWDWNIETGEDYFSPRWQEILGYDEGELPPEYRTFVDLLHPDDRERVEDMIHAHLEERESYDIEIRLRHKGDSYVWVRARGQATWNDQGEPVRMAGSITDISDFKRAAEALRESEERLNAFFDNAPLGLAIYDTDLRYVRINQPLALQSGHSVDEHIGRAFGEIKPEIAGKLEPVYRRILETGEPVTGLEIVAELPSEPGEKRCWWGSAFATVRPDGTPFGIGVVAIDVTDRKRAEQELRESEQRLNAFFDNAPIGLAMYDTDLRYTKINSHLAWKQGMSVGAHIGRTLHDIKPDVAGDLELIYRRVLETGEPNVNFEVAGGLPSDPGTEHWWWGGAFPATWSDGKPSSLGVVAIDITERKQAEAEIRELYEELEQRVEERTAELAEANATLTSEIAERQRVEEKVRESEAQLRIITDNIPALIAYLDSEHRYRFVNRTYCEWAQLPREKLEGQLMRDVLGPDAYRKLAPRIDDALSGRPVNFEEELDFPDDRRRNIEVSYVPEILDDGGIKGIFVLVRDVTERKRTEEALKQARDELARKERLAVLGQLTATVSHELRNPLGTMRSSMFVLDKAIDQADERASRAAERVNRSIVRCDRIIDDLLDFTRAQALDRQPVVVDEWLDELLDELAVPDGVELARDLAAAGVSVEIDPERLRRAVVNLYENACQAVSDGHPEADFGPRIAVRTRLQDERFEIAVSDTGRGIAPDNLGSIFEPLFSTKPFGTGLGLPTVKQIVEGHGGSVEVETEEGRGATFRLLIPLHRADEAAA